jgi:hypothetical protein
MLKFTMPTCALCGRPLEETATWKGRGETCYCSEFCADAESVATSPFVPSAAPGLRERPAAPSARMIPRAAAGLMRAAPIVDRRKRI